MVKPRGEKEILIDCVDFTDQSGTGEAYAEAIHNACAVAEQELNVQVDSVGSDNEPSVRKGARESNLVNYGCTSHIADLAVNSLHNQDLGGEIRQVLLFIRRNIKIQERIRKAGGSAVLIRCETRWKGEKEELESFQKNYEAIMTVMEASDEIDFPNNIRRILRKPFLMRSVEKEILALTPLCTLIDKAQQRDCLLFHLPLSHFVASLQMFNKNFH